MRISTYVLAAIGAVAAAAVIVGALYLLEAPDGRDTGPVTGSTQRPAPKGSTTGAASPVPLPPRPVGAAPLPQVPQPLAETFGPWRVWCELDVQSRENCRAEQVLASQDGKAQLAVVAYPARAGTPARLRIMPPWGVLIEAGLAVRVDALPVVQVPIRNCLPSGCQAEMTLSEGLIGAMRAGTELKIAVVTADGKPVSTSVPLSGFADAYSRISGKSAN